MRSTYIFILFLLSLFFLPVAAGAAYMDVVVDYDRGAVNSDTIPGSSYAGQFNDSFYAVDGEVSTAFNLGIDGWIVLGLSGRAVAKSSQVDVTVNEFGAADEYEVLLSDDGLTWESLGVFGQGRDEYSFMLSNYSLSNDFYRYLKILDYGGPDGTSSPGAELARVDVYNFVQTPVPAAVWLLGSGLIGLAGLRPTRIR